ncbi:hypothetical protein JCM11641_005162 [Rhodosporidiobolus odoratus]
MAPGSAPLVDRLQQGSNRRRPLYIPLELLEELHQHLVQDGKQVQLGNLNVEETLCNDPFTLLSHLLPVLSSQSSRSTASAIARSSLLLLATHASAKEIVLAVGEKVDELNLPSRQDDEDDFDEDQEEDEDQDQDGREEASGRSPRDEAVRLEALVQMYTLALPRIRTLRPLKFLTPIVEPLTTAVGQLFLENAFREPSPDRIPLPGESEEKEGVELVALGLAQGVGELVKGVLAGDWLDKEGEEYRTVGVALCGTLLQEVIGCLHPYFPASLASEFFYARFPAYRQPLGRQVEASAESKAAWASILCTLHLLDATPSDLFRLSSSHVGSPFPRIGNFILLAHHIAADPSLPPSDILVDADPGELLRRSFSVLKTRFDIGPVKVAEDEMLLWMWWCVDKQIESGMGGFEEDVLFPLIEILSTLASLSPSAQTRFLAFRLVSRVVLKCVGSAGDGKGTDESTQLVLVKSLLTETPFPPLRVAAVGLVKEVLDEKFQELEETSPPPPSSSLSLFLTPLFLSELGPLLFCLDPPTTTASETEPGPDSSTTIAKLDPIEFVEQRFSVVMERLKLYYFVLLRDRRDQTGIATPSALTTYESTFLSPLRSSLHEWLAASLSPGGDTEVRFRLELVQDMLERVDGVVRQRIGQ